jgi:DNA-directed RNA polymerase specialized sigma24 family protein
VLGAPMANAGPAQILSTAPVWDRTSLGPDDLGRQRRRVLRAKAGEDRLEVLQAALGRVPLLRRAVLVLHEIDGVSIPEIASALSMWRWTARRRLRRARRELTAAVGALTGGDLRW